MDWQRQCAALIPCFNESANIAEVVRGVRAHLPSVIVVDDGSTDATSEAAAANGAKIQRHETKQGKGAALRTGFQNAREQGFRWALTLDGDGQHASDDIPKLLQCAEQTGAALVVGNRLAGCENMPWLRRQVNRWMTRRLARLAGIPLADSQCGFRLINLEALATVTLATNHFEIESEVLLAFARASLAIEFVPVQVIYRAERSKIHPWRDTIRWFRWWRHARKTNVLQR